MKYKRDKLVKNISWHLESNRIETDWELEYDKKMEKELQESDMTESFNRK